MPKFPSHGPGRSPAFGRSILARPARLFRGGRLFPVYDFFETALEILVVFEIELAAYPAAYVRDVGGAFSELLYGHSEVFSLQDASAHLFFRGC